MRFHSVYSALFMICLYAYNQWIQNDLIDKALMAITLIYLSGCFSFKTIQSSIPSYNNLGYILLQLFILIILIADLSFKIYLLKTNDHSLDLILDFSVTKQILSVKLQNQSIAFLLMVLFSSLTLYSCPRYTPIKNLVDQKISIRALVQPSKYLSIGLLYALSYIDVGPHSFFWIILCAVYAIKQDSLLLLRLVSFGIVSEMWIRFTSMDYIWNYFNKFFHISEVPYKYKNQITLGIQILLLILLQREIFYRANSSQLILEQERQSDVRDRRVSLRRRKSLETYEPFKTIVMILLFTIFLLLTNTTPGSIVFLITLYYHIPISNYLIFTPLQVGGAISLVYKSNNPLFLVYLLTLKFFKSKWFVLNLPKLPLKWIIPVMRLIILFWNINILNIMSAFVARPWMQVFVISIRIIVRIIGYTNQVIGGNYSDNLESWLIDGAISDTPYLLYLLMLLLNDPDEVYSEKLLKKMEIVFHVFRYFHWIAYTLIAGMVLASEQSLFQIFSFVLLLLLLCNELLIKVRTTKLKVQLFLWKIFLYQQVVVIFFNYFFLFSRYEQISKYFQTLTRYHQFIGLYQKSSNPHTVFLLDLAQIGICLISIYIVQIKIHQINCSRSGLQERLLDSESDEVERIYNTYIKTIGVLSQANLWTRIKNSFASISIDLNLVVMMFFHIYWEYNPYYIAYMGFMMLYFIQSYYLPINYNNLFLELQHFLQGRSSYNSDAISPLLIKTHQTREKMQSYKIPTLYLNIIYSAGLIIFNYFILLWNTFIKGDYENRYQFIKMLPQVTIFIFNTLAILFHSQQSFQEPAPMEAEKVWAYKNYQLLLIDILQIVLVTFVGSQSIQNLGFMWVFVISFIIRKVFKYLNLKNQFNILFIAMAFMGIYWGNVLWFLPLFGFRIHMYLKWKFSQTITHTNMSPPSQSTYQSYQIKINIVSELVISFAIPFICFNLQFIKLPLFFILVFYIFQRNFMFFRNYKIHTFFLAAAKIILYVVVLCEGMFMDINRFDSTIYFIIGSFVEIGHFLLKEPDILESIKCGYQLLIQKSHIIAYVLSYLQNQIKLERLKKFYKDRKQLQKNVQQVRTQIDTMRANPSLTFQSLTMLENKESDHDMLLKTYKALYQFNLDQLKDLFQKFHYYIKGATIQKIQDIYSFQQKVISNQKISLFQSINQQRISLGLPSYLDESELTSIERAEHYNKYRNQLIGQFVTTRETDVGFSSLILETFITYIDQVSLIMLALWGVFGGAYTMPINIIAFGWGLVIEGKPKARFWMFCFLYIATVLLIKWFIPFFAQMIIVKIIFVNSADSSFYEGILLVILVAQITLTKMSGMKDKTSVSIQDINQCMLRYTLTRASFGVQNPEQEQTFLQCYHNWDEQQRTKSFFFRRFSKLNFKAGADYYPYICTAQVFITLYIFFFYDSIQLEQKKNTTSLALNYNQFSKHMIVILFMQVMIMIADRCITTLNVYDAMETKQLNFILRFLFEVFGKNEMDLGNFKSQYDLPLVLKYILHILVLVSVNLLVLIYFPSTQNFNKQDQEYFYLSGFFCLFQFYFLFNALQIKHGFTRLKGKNILMTSFHFVNLYIYKVYCAIPFLSEFKKISDWSLTTTALPLFHWLKFQDMYSRLYVSKCETQMLKRKPYGSQMWWMKYVIAPLGFLSIIALVFGPMGIYSDVNPFAVEDQIIGAQLIINLKVNNQLNYKMFSNSHVTKKLKLNASDQYITDKHSLFYIELDKYPDKNIIYSEPVLLSLTDMIDDTIKNKSKNQFSLVMSLIVSQKQGGKVSTPWTSHNLDQKELPHLKSLLQSDSQFTIPLFYSPFPDHLPNISMTFRARPNNWEVFSHPNQTSSFYLVTLPKFQMQFSATYIYITYVLLISRLMKIYLLATVQNAVFQGAEVERVLYLCSAVISARRLQDSRQEQYLYFQLIDLIREPEKMKTNTGSLLEFRQKRC